MLIGKYCKQVYSESIVLPVPCEVALSATLILKKIPDDLFDRLRLAAERSGRSPNDEAIACLEAVLLPIRIMPTERLERARQLRAGLSPAKFSSGDIEALKREDRS